MSIKPFHVKKRFPYFAVFALLILLCFFSRVASAQYFDLQKDKKRVTIPFQLIRDMIILKLKINDRGPYNFVLDSGVGLMLITDPKLVDSIDISTKRTLKIAGLGEGDDYEAYVTSSLKIGIPGLTSYDVAAAILKTDHFGLSNYAGMPIHGLLGFEFFSNLAVKINFLDSVLVVSSPKNIRLFNQGTKIPITIEDRKPYLKAKIIFADGSKTENKLIMDIGAGHSLSIEDAIKKHGLPERFIQANLGIGLTGPIEGYIGRVKEVELGKFKIKDVLTSFPTANNLPQILNRDGNIGMGILKRFNLIIDYPDSAIYLKQRSNFNEPFERDMSGLEYYKTGDDFSRLIISRVEPGSSADFVGIEKDDEITSINFKAVSKMTLEEIDTIFKSKDERSILLEVYHDKKTDHVIITLKRRV